jgi:hypothetical protein
MNKLLSNVIDAHGELDRWTQFTAIEADLGSEGELLGAPPPFI